MMTFFAIVIGLSSAAVTSFVAPNNADLNDASIFPPAFNSHYIYGLTVCSIESGVYVGKSETPNVIVGVGFDTTKNDGKM